MTALRPLSLQAARRLGLGPVYSQDLRDFFVHRGVDSAPPGRAGEFTPTTCSCLGRPAAALPVRLCFPLCWREGGSAGPVAYPPPELRAASHRDGPGATGRCVPCQTEADGTRTRSGEPGRWAADASLQMEKAERPEGLQAAPR